MVIKKYTDEGGNVKFDITDLHPNAFEAIFNGLELLETRHDLQKTAHPWQMLDKMRKFAETTPRSIKKAQGGAGAAQDGENGKKV